MNKFKLIIFTTIFFACVSNLFATSQYPDKIVYYGETHDLHSNPLEAYFKNNPDKKPKSGITSSALWRGYIATFAFDDKTLYLKDIEIQVTRKTTEGDFFETEWKSVIDTVTTKNEKLKIDWLTGLLVIPQGKIVNYVHMGYASTYENYTLLEIDKGILIKSKDFDYKNYAKFKQRQFDAFKKTEEYKQLVDDMKKREDSTEESIELLLKFFVISYSSKILVD